MEPVLQLAHLYEVGLHVVVAALVSDCHCEMGLASSSRSDPDPVALCVDERESLQRIHLSPCFGAETVHVEVV